MIRHFTSLDNVRESLVLDPTKCKHGTLNTRRISALSGWIDPLTHLNLDFPEHLTRAVNVVEKLEPGSGVVLSRGHFVWAQIPESALRHLGDVDVDERTELLNAAVLR
jgi:hypothetical protein